jgi:cation diffusion facilitator family transporter
MAQDESRFIVVAALAGNLLIAVSKFTAAFFTGSSAMLSEGVHSLADTANELLLLYGMHRANAAPTVEHPFGHGREAYFWSFIVALLVFALGAGVSFYEGVHRLLQPRSVSHVAASIGVLAISFVFEGTSWFLALRRVRRTKGQRSYFQAIRSSKNPAVFTVLLEDSAALLGLVIAFAGVATAALSGRAEFDAAASILIALLLAATSFILARETKGLLIGEQAHSNVQAELLQIADANAAIAHANGIFTAQLGPDHVLAALSAEFEDHLTTPQIETCILDLEQQFRAARPEIVAVFVKPQTRATWAHRRAALESDEPSDTPSL